MTTAHQNGSSVTVPDQDPASQASAGQPLVGSELPALDGERSDLLESLAKHRFFLRFTVRDVTDEQAARRTTASELCLGGLIKHVAEDRGPLGGLHGWWRRPR